MQASSPRGPPRRSVCAAHREQALVVELVARRPNHGVGVAAARPAPTAAFQAGHSPSWHMTYRRSAVPAPVDASRCLPLLLSPLLSIPTALAARVAVVRIGSSWT